MNRERQVIEEKGSSAPGYLVTFTALVTLLMLFFITLLSFASTRDDGFGGKGRYTESRESFFRAIRTLGLGMFYVKEQGADFGNIKPKYFITTPDKQFEGRTIRKGRKYSPDFSRSEPVYEDYALKNSCGKKQFCCNQYSVPGGWYDSE